MGHIVWISLAVLAMVIILPDLRRKMSRAAYRKCIILCFAAYLLASAYVTLFSRDTLPKVQFELQIFRTYRESIVLQNGVFETIRNLLRGLPAGVYIADPHLLEGAALNILLYIPMGFMLPQVWRWCREERGFPWRAMLVSFGISLLTECAQWVFHLGWFDLDDLLHNVLGTLVGIGLYARSARERK